MRKTYNDFPNKPLRYANSKLLPTNKTYSQAFQDIFVLTVLNWKSNGNYLEIGANLPDYTNNTFLLSQQFLWRGLSIDCEPSLKDEWCNLRPNDSLIIADATNLDYRLLLKDISKVDYLQLDIDPAPNTLKALEQIPLDKCRFSVITYETDLYLNQENLLLREKARQLFIDSGYTLIVGDVLVDGKHPFEDWWVDLTLVDSGIALEIARHALITHCPQELLFLK